MHGMRVRAVQIACVDCFDHFPTVVVFLFANREEPAVAEGPNVTGRRHNKVEILRRYKFLLAFENNNE